MTTQPMSCRYRAYGPMLPGFLARPLFGDRARYGKVPLPGDPDWAAWRSIFVEMYYRTQKKSLGAISNDWGYSVMQRVDLAGKTVLEIGPGEIEHIRFWRGKPKAMTIVDVERKFLDVAQRQIERAGVSCTAIVAGSPEHEALLARPAQFDVLLSFYSLEHIHPLTDKFLPVFRLLKPGGFLVGAIPTEGGLAWGVGRYFTTRRMAFQRGIDYDKVICWEHVNTAAEVLAFLGDRFETVDLRFHPFRIPSIDMNAIVSFICRWPGSGQARKAA